MKKNQSGFGDFSSFIFVGVFAVIGSLFIVRIFAASKPTVSIQLTNYPYVNSAGKIDHQGVHGQVITDAASSCTTSGSDARWVAFKVVNGNNKFDSHPLFSGSYTYNLTCKNAAGETMASQTIDVL